MERQLIGKVVKITSCHDRYLVGKVGRTTFPFEDVPKFDEAKCGVLIDEHNLKFNLTNLDRFVELH